MAAIDITSAGGGGTLDTGILQLENGVAMSTTLTPVTDQSNTASQLKLASNLTQVAGTLQIKTDETNYIDIEDASGDNRFAISRLTTDQIVRIDFASNPVGSTTQVGAIRTFTNGSTLGDVVKFREDGQVTFTERVNVEADSLVTTQSSSVIAATTTNANLVIAPNGTGALVAQIPDGTATGGNARGVNAVDLQTSRTLNTEVAAGSFSTILGGANNTSSGSGTVSGGVQNTASGIRSTSIGFANTSSGEYSTTFGSNNTASSNYATVSGGQSNTASTNTHATVVGGQSNTSNGQYSLSGGQSNTASNIGSVALGISNTASGQWSFTANNANSASGQYATAFGVSNTSSGQSSFVIGLINEANATNSFAAGRYSLAYLYSQQSVASGNFVGSTKGQAQQSNLIARRQATLTTGGTTVLSLDGTGTTNLIIPDGTDRMWNVQVRWVAVVNSISGTATGVTIGDTKTSTDLLAVAKRGGVTTVSAHTSAGTHAIETIAGSLTASNIAYTAGASEEMAITFTGPTFAGGGSVTMRVVAAISLTEVAY